MPSATLTLLAPEQWRAAEAAHAVRDALVGTVVEQGV